MILKLLGYGSLLGGAIHLERQHGIASRMAFPDLIFSGPLFAAYLGLLYVEVRAAVRRGETQSRIQWAGFDFSAGVGAMWAFALSTYRGTLPMLEGPLAFIGFLFSYIVIGAMWGVLGAVVSRLMLRFIFRRDAS